MGRGDLRIAVPAYFRCPISLDIMKSPVSLSTGVTYDRSSIEKWLEEGHNTCPATMQALQTKELIPNHTLQRLIQAWCSSSSSSFSHPSDPQLLRLLLQNITHEALKDLCSLAEENEEYRVALLKAGAVPVMVSLLSSIDPSTASTEAIGYMEEAMKLLLLIHLDDMAIRVLASPKCLMAIAWLLKTGGSNIYAAMLVERLACNNEMKQVVGGSGGLMEGLLNMLREKDPSCVAVNASLKCLMNLCSVRRNKVGAIEGGAVEVMVRLLKGEANNETSEKVLCVLSLLTGCAEGRSAIMEFSPDCVGLLMKALLRLNNNATQNAIAILWAICYTSPHTHLLSQAMLDCNGVAKIVLLLQSSCNSITKQKAAELLKLCGEIENDDRPSLQDSHHTHIKPF